MKNVLITGSSGFIGSNLYYFLSHLERFKLHRYDRRRKIQTFNFADIDFVAHLAGVNRPENNNDFETGNVQFCRFFLEELKRSNSKASIFYASSTQASLDNPYGKSKKTTEDLIFEYSRQNGLDPFVYRFSNIFGKWSQPNYNSVVATFCHHIAKEMPVEIHDQNKEIQLHHVDQVCQKILDCIEGNQRASGSFLELDSTYPIQVGTLVEKLNGIHLGRKGLKVPNLSSKFDQLLYSTYLSFLPQDQLNTSLNDFVDERGKLFEMIKSDGFGQIFISTSKPGVKRGNHFHHQKVEKFCLIKGLARVELRDLRGEQVYTYEMKENPHSIVDIPPGFAHSIENISDNEDMIVLFWASEIFDKNKPDTFLENVRL